jgi:uncharacterized protein YkwD
VSNMGFRSVIWVAGLLLTAAATVQADSVCLQSRASGAYEQAMIRELNRVRTDPAGFGRDLERYFSGLGNDRILVKQDGSRIRMTEGRSAVREALAYLKKAKAQPPLSAVSCLSMAAAGHVSEQSVSGDIGHSGRDGSGPSDRAGRFLSDKAYCGENISYGKNSPFEVLVQLVVDDGVPSRGHRDNVFRADYQTAGFASGTHPRYEQSDVMLLCMNRIAETNVSDASGAAANSDPAIAVTELATETAPKTGIATENTTKGATEIGSGTGGASSAESDERRILEQSTHSSTRESHHKGVKTTTITTVVTTRYSDGSEEEETTTETTEEWQE